MDLSTLNAEVDLETFSTEDNAVIISIGAVKFDENGIIDEFFVNVNPADGKALGFDISADTLDWWKKQKEGVLKQSLQNAIPLKDGIQQFVDWYGNKSIPIWSNGSNFDLVILRHHFKHLGISCPYKYWDECCHRTIAKLDTDGSLKPKAEGDLHNALVDAKLQAKHLINIWKAMND